MTTICNQARLRTAKIGAPRPTPSGELSVSTRTEIFGPLLKKLRQRQGLSQLALATECFISQRHVSFLESGKCGVSKPTLSAIARALSLTQLQKRRLFAAAGFVLPRNETTVHELRSQQTSLDSLVQIIEAHNPFPGLVIDDRFNIRYENAAFRVLLGLKYGQRDLHDDAGRRAPNNFIELVFDSQVAQTWLTNSSVVQISFLQLLQQRDDGSDLGLSELIGKVTQRIALDNTRNEQRRCAEKPLTPDFIKLASRYSRTTYRVAFAGTQGVPIGGGCEYSMMLFFPDHESRSRTSDQNN